MIAMVILMISMDGISLAEKMEKMYIMMRLEMTRLAKHYMKKYDGKEVSSLSKKEKKEYDKYQKIMETIKAKKEEMMQQSMGVMMITEAFKNIKKEMNGDLTEEKLKNFKSDDESLQQAASMIFLSLTRSFT